MVASLTHLLKLIMSFLDWTSLGRRAARWGTRMTPMYLLEFLGDRSRLMSISGVPLTLSSSRMRVVSSSFESESLSKRVEWVEDRRNSEKLEWMKSTAERQCIMFLGHRDMFQIFYSYRSAVAHSVECPLKVPVWCSSTFSDLGSNPGAAVFVAGKNCS